MSESSDLKICSIENKNEAKEVGRRETMEKKKKKKKKKQQPNVMIRSLCFCFIGISHKKPSKA